MRPRLRKIRGNTFPAITALTIALTLPIFDAPRASADIETLTKQYSASELQQDFEVATQALIEAHSALFEHISKEELEKKSRPHDNSSRVR